MNKIKKHLLDLLFPKFCLGCKKEGTFLCEDCLYTLDISEFDYCLCNKNPIRILPNSNLGKCERCKDKKLSGLFSVLPYNENKITKKLIHQFKYQPYLKDLSEDLSKIIIHHFEISGIKEHPILNNSFLIPIPIHKNKLKLRGYNQSEELAKKLSIKLNIPLITDVLIKTKNTKSQMESSRPERENNIINAFKIKNPEKISGKNILLVDDVYTTGSTMNECAKILKESGAKQVWGIVVARE